MGKIINITKEQWQEMTENNKNVQRKRIRDRIDAAFNDFYRLLEMDSELKRERAILEHRIAELHLFLQSNDTEMYSRILAFKKTGQTGF